MSKKNEEQIHFHTELAKAQRHMLAFGVGVLLVERPNGKIRAISPDELWQEMHDLTKDAKEAKNAKP